MSFTRTVTIQCDGCERWCDDGGHWQTATDARWAAKARGWIRNPDTGSDLCNVCVAAGADTAEETT